MAGLAAVFRLGPLIFAEICVRVKLSFWSGLRFLLFLRGSFGCGYGEFEMV